MTTEIDLGIDHLDDIEVIGRGGFSVVYSATHSLFKRQMAVKVLNRLAKDSERRRFERECEVMGRLSDHPNVVSVFNAGYSSDGNPYLLMELVAGGTLDDQLSKRGRLPWAEAVRHLIPIASALERAHREKILHRDVKPENILLNGDVPLLADFGIASLRDATGATSTHITASMAHTAPETFENKRDERSDLYSLASTLHALVAGRPPFWRDGDNSLHPMMNRLLNEPPPRLPADLAPSGLADLVQRELAKDPNARHQSVAEFRHGLEAVLQAEAGVEPPVVPNVGPPVEPGVEPAPGSGSSQVGFAPPGVDQSVFTPLAPAPSTGFASGPAVPGSPVPGNPVMPTGGATGATVAGPGWYHAPGDPPNTHRYWSGQQWEGGPQNPWSDSVPMGANSFVGATLTPVKASGMSRLVARSIDYGVWFVLFVAGIWPFFGGEEDATLTDTENYVNVLLAGLATTVLIALYEIVMVGAFGATLGKLLTGLRVVRLDGSPAGYATATARQGMNLALGAATALIYVPLIIAFGLAIAGGLMIFSDGRGQTPWDKLAKTMVVHR